MHIEWPMKIAKNVKKWTISIHSNSFINAFQTINICMNISMNWAWLWGWKKIPQFIRNDFLLLFSSAPFIVTLFQFERKNKSHQTSKKRIEEIKKQKICHRIKWHCQRMQFHTIALWWWYDALFVSYFGKLKNVAKKKYYPLCEA